MPRDQRTGTERPRVHGSGSGGCQPWVNSSLSALRGQVF